MDFGVVLTAYNCEPFLKASLFSVFSQTLQPKEVVAIDDNSSDKTFEILKRLKGRYRNLKIFRNERNLERCLSRNLGTEKLNTEIVCFLDCDDLWKRNYLEEVRKLFERGADFTFGLPKGFVDERGKLLRLKKVKGETFEELLFSGRVGYPSGSCFKRKLLLKEGGYLNRFLYREDWEILLRFYLQGYKASFKKNLPYKIREHGKRTSRDRRFLEATVKVYEHYKDKIPSDYKPLLLHHLAVQCFRFNRKRCGLKFFKEGGWKVLNKRKYFWEIFKRVL